MISAVSGPTRTRTRLAIGHQAHDRPGDVVLRRVGRRLARDRDLPGVDDRADVALERVRGEDARAVVEGHLREPRGAGSRRAAQQVPAGEVGDERARRARHQLGRGPVLDDAAVDEHADPVGQRGRVLEVVGDEQRGERERARAARPAPRARARACERRAPRGARRGGAPPGRGRGRARGRRAGARRRRARPAARREARRSRAAPAARRPAPARRRRRSPPRSCAGRGRTPGRRGRPSGAPAEGRPSPPSRTSVSAASATRPRSGRRSPAIARSTLVLPAPEGPTSATVSRPTSSSSSSRKERSVMYEADVKRVHEGRSFTERRTVRLTRTSSAPIAIAMSGSRSSWA